MIGLQPNDDFSQDITCSPEGYPFDSVSCLSWLPYSSQQIFACASWDATVRVYSFLPVSPLKLERRFDLFDPCLSVDWSPNFPVGGFIDGTIRIFDLIEGNVQIVGGENSKHQDAVKSVHWIDDYQTVVSLSYDRTMKLWDSRQRSEIHTIKLEGKPYCSDMKYPTIAVGFNDRRVGIANISDILHNPQSIKWSFIPKVFNDEDQITDISMFCTERRFGFGACSDFGNGSIYDITQDINNTFKANRIMVFKAHYFNKPGSKQIVFPVNAIGMHRTTQALFTAGGDGNINFWNYGQKDKTGTIKLGGIPVTKAKFNRDDSLVAYANGYDYAQGIQGAHSYKTRIGVHIVKPKELSRLK